MSRGPANARLAALLATLAAALAACESGGGGSLTGPSLDVAPCTGDAAKVFAPVDFAFDVVHWYRSPGVAILQLRRGWRDPNESDLAVLEISDLPTVEALRSADPTGWIPFEGLARVTVVLNQRCPDMVQPLEARTGEFQMDAFDLSVGGRVAGHARFDLVDARAPEGSPPVGADMVLDFHVNLSEKDPETGLGRK